MAEAIFEKKKKKKRRLWMIPVFILFGFAVAVLMFFALFRVNTVEVVGSTQYADADVERMVLDGGFMHQNTIYLAKIKKTVVPEDVPFIQAIDIEYVDRSTVRLHVSENLAIGRIEQEGFYYYFDVSGVVLNVESTMLYEQEHAESTGGADVLQAETVQPGELEQTGSDTEFHPALTEYIPIVTGLTDDPVVLGKKIQVPDDSIFQTILTLTKLLDRFEIEPDRLDVDELGQITMYFGNARIALGDDELLEEKVSRASAILPQLIEEELSGVLHLDTYTAGQQNIIFTQDSGEEESLENADGENAGEGGTEDAGTGGEQPAEGGEPESPADGEGNDGAWFDEGGTGGNGAGGADGELTWEDV